MNASLDTASEVPGVYPHGSMHRCKYGFGADQGGLGCESPQGMPGGLLDRR